MKKIIIPERLAWLFAGDRHLLQRSEVAVITSTSNVETRSRHLTERADVIVADLIDPQLPGDELCRQVRMGESARHVPILLLCPNQEADQHRASSCHASGVLLLPLKANAFFESIARLLAMTERKSFRVLVSVHMQVAQRQETFLGVSRDISVSGLLLETERVIAQGERLSCTFYLPGGRPVHAPGDVVRSVTLPDGTRQYGIRFDTLAPEILRALEEFLRTFASEANGGATSI